MSEDGHILEKIRKMLDDEKMRDSVKIANIYSLIQERYKYYTKPWYIKQVNEVDEELKEKIDKSNRIFTIGMLMTVPTFLILTFLDWLVLEYLLTGIALIGFVLIIYSLVLTYRILKERKEGEFVKVVSVKAFWLCPDCDEKFEQTLYKCPFCGYKIGTSRK